MRSCAALGNALYLPRHKQGHLEVCTRATCDELRSRDPPRTEGTSTEVHTAFALAFFIKKIYFAVGLLRGEARRTDQKRQARGAGDRRWTIGAAVSAYVGPAVDGHVLVPLKLRLYLQRHSNDDRTDATPRRAGSFVQRTARTRAPTSPSAPCPAAASPGRLLRRTDSRGRATSSGRAGRSSAAPPAQT